MNYLTDLINGINTNKAPGNTIRVLGIDLGTTNSAVAEIVYRPGTSGSVRAKCLDIEQYTQDGPYIHSLIPSAVALYGGKVIVGEGAKRLIAKTSEYKLVRNKNLFYECKNDIGNNKTYHKAGEGFGSASQIGGKVLDFINSAAVADDDTPLSRTVVTVPASFQAAQRHDTLRAANLAGIKLKDGDLLDEPLAAFQDYIITYDKIFAEIAATKKLIVFDFGGGTCDVAVFNLRKSDLSGQIEIEPLAVSRYHRLGGGDIDRAIFYEILMPQIMEQNGIAEFELGYKEKKDFIEPAFIGLAEALKISLCKEITRLIRFNVYQARDKNEIIVKQPGIHECKLNNKIIKLRSPQMSAMQFEAILSPFLEKDLLYPRETEYRWTCSIFAPLQDALDRCGLDGHQVDYCLLVGGSSLIPQVSGAVGEFFPTARLLTYPDADSLQTAIARGAAYHAFALAVFGKGLVQPVSHDSIFIRTNSGLQEIIPRGEALPYPSDGTYAVLKNLKVPKTSMVESVGLRVEIVGGNDERLLFKGKWDISAPVSKGDLLSLEYRYSENQILNLRMYLNKGDEESCFPLEIENPFTNLVNPQGLRVLIDELEEDLFTNKTIPHSKVPDRLVKLANLYSEFGQYEKAVHYLKAALQGKKRPHAEILNKLAIYSGKLGDWKGEEKYYREAAVACSWNGAWFNLALAQRQRGLNNEAIISADKAITGEREAPYLVLRAMLADATSNVKDREYYLGEAMKVFASVSVQNDWELGWYLKAAQMAGDAKGISEAKAEQRKRAQHKDIGTDDDLGLLPEGPSLPAIR